MRRVSFEIVNMCNLSCPSCPEGRINYAKLHDSFAYADIDLCEQIFKKMHDSNETFEIYLYQFCEPLLHPQLDEILSIMDNYNLTAYISSNLNISHDWKKLLAHPALKRLTVSVSGFTQDVYERGHRGGRVERVLENLKQISEVLKNNDAATEITIFFHQYVDNFEDEQQYQNLCDEYGFSFVPSPACVIYNPWEATDFFQGEHKHDLQDAVTQTLPRIILNKDLFMRKIHGLEALPCFINTSEDFSIDWQGNLRHGCCMTVMDKQPHLGSILDYSLQQLPLIAKNSPLCKDCKQSGYHIQFSLMPYVEYSYLAKRRKHNHAISISAEIHNFIKKNKSLQFLQESTIYLHGIIPAVTAGMVNILLNQGYTVKVIDDSQRLQNTTFCNLPILHSSQLSSEDLAQGCIIMCFIRDQHETQTYKQAFLAKGARFVYALHEFIRLNDAGIVRE